MSIAVIVFLFYVEKSPIVIVSEVVFIGYCVCVFCIPWFIRSGVMDNRGGLNFF